MTQRLAQRSAGVATRFRSRRGWAAGAAAVLFCAGLSACSGGSGKPTLNWYVNPDGVDTLTALAKSCSTDEYDIEIQLLPSGATDQRTQLARRLAAKDSSTDLMSLDPVFVAEFANAKWLEQLPEETATRGHRRRRPGRAQPRPSPGTTGSTPSRSGPTPRSSGTASPSQRRPGST